MRLLIIEDDIALACIGDSEIIFKNRVFNAFIDY